MEIRLRTDLKRDGQRYTRGAVIEVPEGEVLDLIQCGAAEHIVAIAASPADPTAVERDALLAGFKQTNAELAKDNQALRKELERARNRKHTGPDAAELRELKAKLDKQDADLAEADEAFAQLRTQNDDLRSENVRLTAEAEALRNQILTMQNKAIGDQVQPAQTAQGNQGEQAANSGKGGKSDAK